MKVLAASFLFLFGSGVAHADWKLHQHMEWSPSNMECKLPSDTYPVIVACYFRRQGATALNKGIAFFRVCFGPVRERYPFLVYDFERHEATFDKAADGKTIQRVPNDFSVNRFEFNIDPVPFFNKVETWKGSCWAIPKGNPV
jgi:hypothetical protein